MGIPRFFRWIAERYPLCLNDCNEEYLPDFDNFYVDLNGIVHNCSHGDSAEDTIGDLQIFKNVAAYISWIFALVKPRNVFYLAMDGVAPRAKINQQRSRRFQAARELAKFTKPGPDGRTLLLSESVFDSNCITPGTKFMAELDRYIRHYLVTQISTQPAWENVKVIYSGYRTPGEGEHKIMEYIRYIRSCEDYNHNTRHCLFGPDADLIVLSLLAHEPHFAILRPEVIFNSKSSSKVVDPSTVSSVNFFFFHISLLRDYLDIEFSELKTTRTVEYDIEHILDDFSILTFLLGNDFIPNLPKIMIVDNHIPFLTQVYKKCFVENGYICPNGVLNLKSLEMFFRELEVLELDKANQDLQNTKWVQSKSGTDNDCNSMDISKLEYLTREQSKILGNFDDILASKSSRQELNLSKDIPSRDRKFIEQLAEKLGLSIESSSISNKNAGFAFLDNESSSEYSLEDVYCIKWPAGCSFEYLCSKSGIIDTLKSLPVLDDEEISALVDKKGKASAEKYYEYWKRTYYKSKMEIEYDDKDKIRKLVEAYTVGLQWVTEYYFKGVPSWRWYYPYHYAPLISDLVNISSYKHEFTLMEPYLPFEQLMSVIPRISYRLAPAVYANLLQSNDERIARFYPKDYDVDPNGKKVEWEFVVKLPFIDEAVLLEVLKEYSCHLTSEEKDRNREEPAFVYQFSKTLTSNPIEIRIPGLPPVSSSRVKIVPLNVEHFTKTTSSLFPDTRIGLRSPFGFPTLKTMKLTWKFQKGNLKVFNVASTRESVILYPNNPLSKISIDGIINLTVSKPVYIGWPFLRPALCFGVYERSKCIYIPRNPNRNSPVIKTLPQAIVNKVFSKCDEIASKYSQRLGVEIGAVEYAVKIRIIEGTTLARDGSRKYRFEDSPKEDMVFPLQLVVDSTRYKDHRYRLGQTVTMEEDFPIGSYALFLGPRVYGSLVCIQGYSNPPTSLNILAKVNPPRNAALIAKQCEELRDKFLEDMDYIPLHATASLLGIDPGVLSKITSRFTIQIPKKKENVNICLGMKSTAKRLKVHGYTNIGPRGVEYSAKARALISKYKAKFPEIVSTAILGANVTAEELFRTSAYIEKIDEVRKWLADNHVDGFTLVSNEVQVLDDAYLPKLFSIVIKASQEDSDVILVKKVPRLALMRPEHCDQFNKQVFRICDRVVQANDCGPVDLGTRGTIIFASETRVKVMFDTNIKYGYRQKMKYNSVKDFPSLAICSILNVSNCQRMFNEYKD